MDSSNRRRIRKNNSRKPHEMNGNNQSSSCYKTDNTHRKNSIGDCCNKEQDFGRMSKVYSNYMQGQRLFTAVSEPAVCGYPMSLGFSYPDHFPVPFGYPTFHPQPYPHKVPHTDKLHSPKTNQTSKHHGRHEQCKDTFQTVDEYTSLPPGNLHDIESDQHRRFSDPGLANDSGSEEDSLSEKESLASCYADSELPARIESLVQENKQLSKELKDTQMELQNLKLELASLATVQSSCEPGFISDLVREVHEATKLKEDTLLAKVKLIVENVLNSKTLPPLSRVTQTENDVTQRLLCLEEQMKTILAHNSVHENVKKELKDCQESNLQLKEELKSAVEAKDLAEATATKYERLFNVVKKNLPNGLIGDEKDKAMPPSLLESPASESLTSSLGSGSLPPYSPSPQAQVTMSGPVTDL